LRSDVVAVQKLLRAMRRSRLLERWCCLLCAVSFPPWWSSLYLAGVEGASGTSRTWPFG
jgi:hypothetical protein